MAHSGKMAKSQSDNAVFPAGKTDKIPFCRFVLAQKVKAFLYVVAQLVARQEYLSRLLPHIFTLSWYNWPACRHVKIIAKSVWSRYEMVFFAVEFIVELAKALYMNAIHTTLKPLWNVPACWLYAFSSHCLHLKIKKPRRSGAKILIFRAWLFAFHKFKVLFHLLENPHGGVVQLSVRLAPAVHNGA